MDAQLIICLVIFALTIASFLWGKISMAVTALIAMILLMLTGCITASEALAGFSNSNTIIMASMFVISAGFSKTQMVTRLSKLVARVSKGSFTKVLAGYVLVTCLIAQIVPSAMAVFSIVFPLAVGVCREMEVSPSKMMFSIGIVAIATVTTLPFGAGAAYPAQYNGIFASLGVTEYSYNFWDICVGRMPALIFMVLYAIFIAPRFAPDKPVIAVADVKPVGVQAGAEAPVLKRGQEITGYVVFFGVVLGLILTSMRLIKVPVQGDDGTVTMTAIDTCVFPLLGAIIMVAAGILKPREAYGSIGLGGMVLLYVGVLALATGLTNTGAGSLVGNAIASLFGANANGYVLGFVFSLAPFLLTQVMMNWAVLNIFCPIAILTCSAIGASPLGPTLLVCIGSLTAFMTPLATPSVAMFMGIGGYDQKTMFKMSWLPALCMCVLNVLWVMTIFPAFPA